MRILLRSLQLEALRSIREALEFKFPERGLVLIKGKNLDTGGSSGAGKTNLFLGISLALGYCPFPGTELQSWDTDQKYRVKLELGRPDKDPLTVVRSSAGGSVGAEKMAKPAQALLQSYLGGLDAEMLRLLTYAQQDDQKDFLSLDPKGKFDFLSQMFPEIANLEKVGEKAEKIAAQAEAQLQILKPQMLQLTQRAAAAQLALSQAGGVEALHLEKDRLNEWAELARSNSIIAHAAQERARSEKEDRVAELQKLVSQAWARNEKIRHDASERAQAVRADAQPQFEALQKEVTEAQAEVTDHRKSRTPDDRNVKLGADPHFQQLQEQLKTAEMHLARVTAAYEKAKSDATQQRFANAIKQGQLKARIQEIKTAAKPLPRLTQELDRMQANQCPTCSQPWVNEEEIARRKAEVLTLSTNLLEVPLLEGEVTSLGQPVADPPAPAQLPRLQEIKAQISEAMNEMVRAEVSRLQVDHQLEGEARANRLAAAQGRLNDLSRELEEKRAAILVQGKPTQEQVLELQHRARDLELAQKQPVPDFGFPQLQQELEQAQKQVNDNARAITDKQIREEVAKREWDQAQTATTELLAKIQVLEEEQRLESDIGEVLSRTGFLSALFTEILEEIGLEANRILQQTPNTAEVSIRFVSEQENNSGKTVRGIRAQVTVRGHEAEFRSGASGGMKTAIRMAVRFAVRAVASRRTGVYPGWVCLDEPFNGLGPVEKEACMEILKFIAETDLVMVVDHGSEFQALFDQQISLVLDKGITRIA